jgi:predicted amidohydrolase
MTLSATNPPPALSAAAIQMTSTEDVERNLSIATTLVRRARTLGATLVGLPENFAFLGADRDHRLTIAEPLDPADTAFPGPILRTMAALARDTGVHLLLGGFPERGLRPDRIRNTAVLLDPTGDMVACYRKIHLFDVDLPGGARFRESDAIEAGDQVVVAPFPWGGLGLSVCYDLRFPELYRGLAAAGARVLAVPSAFTAETG